MSQTNFFGPQKYGTIYADPPWMESGGGQIKRGADRHYPLMSTEAICALGWRVRAMAALDAHLWLWVTSNFLADGLQVMSAWGFRYVTSRIWVKESRGLGQYVGMRHELLLLGVRGQPGYVVGADGKRFQPDSVIEAPRGEHSEKPAIVREEIARMSPGPFVELFARETSPGWECWGNEVEPTVTL